MESEAAGIRGESPATTTELALSQKHVSANPAEDQRVKNSPRLIDAGVVNTVEVAAFEAPPSVERASGSEHSDFVREGGGVSQSPMDQQGSERSSSKQEGDGASLVRELHRGSGRSNLVLQEDNGSSPGGDFTLECTGREEEAGPAELKLVAGIRLADVLDRYMSEPSAPAELFHSFATPSPTPSVSASTTTTSVVLTWCLPDPDDGRVCPGAIFEIKTKLCTSIGWTSVYYGRANTYTMIGLPPGTHIDFFVRAVNLVGINRWSAQYSTCTLPAPPGAPSALTALTVGSSKVELGWRPPVHDGGSCISGFCVEMNDLQQSAWRDDDQQQRFVTLYCGNNSRFIAEGLEPGCTYCFRVLAFSMLGAGPFSESIVLETHPAPPAIPDPPVIVDKTFKSISLSWSFPLHNGAPVKSFILQMLFLGYGEKCLPCCDDITSTSHYDLQGANLKNSAGTSDNDCKHGVVFERFVDRPGSAIYDVYIGPSNDIIIKKLQPFSTYAFRVQAQNVAGSSGFSVFSICMTSPASPSPSPPTVVETTSSLLTLRWEVPEKDNGSPVFRYTLEMLKVGFNREILLSKERNLNLNGDKKLRKKKMGKQAAAVHFPTQIWEPFYDGHDLQCQVAGLSPGNEYSFRVKAQNALGMSSPSSILVARTLPAEPGAPKPPTFFQVTPTSVQMKWSSPACENGKPVTSYKLMLDDGQGGQLQKVYEGEAKLYKASKLVPASSYHAAVQAVNAHGTSELSEVAVVELPVAPPPRAAPATVVAEPPYKERPAPATVVAESPNKERPVPTGSIKSKKEVKKLMRQKAQQPWSQKVTKFISQNIWPNQLPWPRWAQQCIYAAALFATLLLLKML